VIIGLPKEIKDNEYRVGLTPAGVRALTDASHRVLVEKDAGEGSGFEDSLYARAGATIIESADDVWTQAEMIVKVKEPIAPEYPRMREGHLLFTYLHLAPDNELTEQLLQRKVTGVAYETITDRKGTLPLLTPMSPALLTTKLLRKKSPKPKNPACRKSPRFPITWAGHLRKLKLTN